MADSNLARQLPVARQIVVSGVVISFAILLAAFLLLASFQGPAAEPNVAVSVPDVRPLLEGGGRFTRIYRGYTPTHGGWHGTCFAAG